MTDSCTSSPYWTFDRPYTLAIPSPTCKTGFNDNLKTIKSKTFELGISNYNIKNNFNYSVRFFNISTINEITPYESSSGLRLYRNAGKTTKKGVEMEINSKISNNLNLDYSLTIGSYKFDDLMWLDIIDMSF